jgi:hypothetical protein
MRETKYWTWHMAAGVVIGFLLGLHMLTMHVGGITHWFAPAGGEAISQANSLFRDGSSPSLTSSFWEWRSITVSTVCGPSCSS